MLHLPLPGSDSYSNDGAVIKSRLPVSMCGLINLFCGSTATTVQVNCQSSDGTILSATSRLIEGDSVFMTKGGGRHGLQKSSPWQMGFSLLWRGLNRIEILWFIVGGGEALNWVNCWPCGTGRTCHAIETLVQEL